MPPDYNCLHLANGIKLTFMPCTKFKTISIGLFLHQLLDSHLAARTALLPAVLEQGCRLYPDYLTLQREMENLYGADISTDIMKSGERHIMAFTIETAHDRFLGEKGRLLQRGMAVLSAVTADPLVTDNTFREDYVEQEKKQLIKDIKALLNDKAAYASERCVARMCEGERFGVNKLGRIEDYKEIGGADLYDYYRNVFRHNPLEIFVVGDLDEREVIRAAEGAFNIAREEGPVKLPETVVEHTPSPVRCYEEMMAVNQAKLVLGYRTATGFCDELHYPLLVYSGILGGFPHSKLFMKVREEASLAYYIHSRLERHKGLMFISAGINDADRDKVREIVDSQLEDMVRGKISDVELENTRQGLINKILSQQDSPGGMISFHLDGSVGGKTIAVEEMIAGIEAVTREEIMTVAERIVLDTVFLLRPQEGGATSEQ